MKYSEFEKILLYFCLHLATHGNYLAAFVSFNHGRIDDLIIINIFNVQIYVILLNNLYILGMQILLFWNSKYGIAVRI